MTSRTTRFLSSASPPIVSLCTLSTPAAQHLRRQSPRSTPALSAPPMPLPQATSSSRPHLSSSAHPYNPPSLTPPGPPFDTHTRPRLSPKDLNIGAREGEYFSLPTESLSHASAGGNAPGSPSVRTAFNFGTLPSVCSPGGTLQLGAGERKSHAMTEGTPPTALAFAPVLPASIRAHRPSPLPRPAVISRHTAFAASEFIALLHASSSDPSKAPLVLDIRTHTAYTTSRVTQSLNICVPSTLLRRPAYDLSRIGDSLSPQDHAELDRWSSVDVVIVLDGEGTQLVQGGGVSSLLDKFERVGFKGRLGFVQGGFAEVSRELRGAGGKNGWLSYGQQAGGSGSAALGTLPATPSLKHGRPVLQVRDLPVAAFQQASTSAFTHAGLPSAAHNMGPFSLGRGASGASSRGSGGSSRGGMGKRRKGTMETGVSTPDGSPSSEGGAGTTLTPGGESSGEKRMASNPFFDNIRQNSEALSLTRSLSNLAPIDLPDVPTQLLPLLPPFLRSLLSLAPLERAQILARQYYELELAERERLEGTLAWHANEQGKADGIGEESTYKKFGISAGVELGGLNRFKNIFPYDHARVRLQVPNASSTDYINASHLSLLSSSTSYIASQGPLPTTYDDFWNMCDQEQVGVIIMLTNLKEGGRDKCGRYWAASGGGECWNVRVEREDGVEEDEEEVGGGGGFFATKEPKTSGDDSVTIRRTIHLTHKLTGRTRKVRHIQYCAWPDFDIPAKPSDVISLVREVESAQRDYLAERGTGDEGKDPPVLAHCSAGVGRTGVFIMVSSILEKFRRERSARLDEGKDDAMEIDIPSPRTSFFPLPSTDLPTTTLESGSEASDSDIPEPSPSSVTSDTSLLAHDLRASTLNPPPSSPPREPSPLPTTSASPPPALSPPLQVVPPLERVEPIFSATNELREGRMSMIANYRQYVCVVECTLVGLLEELQSAVK